MADSKKPFRILINKYAGTAQDLGQDALENIIRSTLPDTHKVEFLDAEQIISVLKTFDSSTHILVGGGDGTIRSAAAALYKTNQSFGILPMGTMNLLAKDLNIPITIPEALKAYAHKVKETKIDIAFANDYLFLCSAGLGLLPASSEFREQNRHEHNFILWPKLAWFILDRFDKKRSRKYKIYIDHERKSLKSSTLVISNNKYIEYNSLNNISLQKETLNGGTLALYSLTPSHFIDKCRILMRLGLGGWKKDPVMNEYIAKNICIHNRKRFDTISVDGETVTLKMPIKFQIKPKGLSLIIPEKDVT